MASEFINAFSDFPRELLDKIREKGYEPLEEATFEERVVGIENATATLLEVGVDETQIIQMLQKYWDLRLSEAKYFVQMQKDKKNRYV